MKVLLVGCGSIGLRHLRNLLALYPDAEIVACDPDMERAAVALSECKNNKSMANEFFGEALTDNRNADCAIIATPDSEHAKQAACLYDFGIPYYLEKPACDLSLQSINVLREISRSDKPTALGYQYRFHPVVVDNYARWQSCGYLRFFARDDLQARYGDNCLSVMAAHPIDTALYVLGPAQKTAMQTNGLSVTGRIWHIGGGLSEFDIAMQRGPRVSTVKAGDGGGWSKTYDLYQSDEMYQDALRAWLDWVQGGDRDKRTATLAEGWASIEVMRQIKQV